MDKKVIGRVATLALGKNDQEDQDAEKTANPYRLLPDDGTAADG